MKYVIAFLLATINFCGAFAQVGFDAKARAKECIYLFRQEKFETLYQRMDKDMQRLLDVEKLEGILVQFRDANGCGKRGWRAASYR